MNSSPTCQTTNWLLRYQLRANWISTIQQGDVCFSNIWQKKPVLFSFPKKEFTSSVSIQTVENTTRKKSLSIKEDKASIKQSTFNLIWIKLFFIKHEFYATIFGRPIRNIYICTNNIGWPIFEFTPQKNENINTPRLKI